VSRPDRTDSSPAAAPAKPGGKGRPTPSRKEAEAAARARAKTPRTRKEIVAANRKARTDASAKMREAYRTGDDKALPTRDRGPVRRFVRDYIDVRFSFIELLLPILVLTLIMGFSSNPNVIATSQMLMLGAMILIILEMVFLRFKLRKELKTRFPDANLSGTTYYAIMRAMQMKFMRLPKPRHKIGTLLGDDYR
jgi:hypothetical protein